MCGVDFRLRMRLSCDTKYDVSCWERRIERKAHIQGSVKRVSGVERREWHG